MSSAHETDFLRLFAPSSTADYFIFTYSEFSRVFRMRARVSGKKKSVLTFDFAGVPNHVAAASEKLLASRVSESCPLKAWESGAFRWRESSRLLELPNAK